MNKLALATFLFITSISASGQEIENYVQNALLVNISSTINPGQESSEQIVSINIQLSQKPSTWFYEVDFKKKAVIFEFNDTKSSVLENSLIMHSPITACKFEEKVINVKKSNKVLKPDSHNQLRVSFYFKDLPMVFPKDSGDSKNIYFTFKWSSDPQKLKYYILHENVKKDPFILSFLGLLVVFCGVFLFRNHTY